MAPAGRSVVDVTQPGSLDVIEDAVRREFDAQERRAESVDGKAGLVLGFASVFVSLGADFVWLPCAVAARLLAGAAALVALRAFAPRRLPSVDLDAFRARHATDDPAVTRDLLVLTLIDFHELTRRSLVTKTAAVRTALALLTIAVALTVAGATVNVALERAR